MTGDEYKTEFGLPAAKKTDAEKALSLALEVRKFEIELYWKRATYFWAFLAITLGGYFTVLGAKFQQCSEKGEALLTISCLGFVFAVAWYFVNRASKFWQENWENHVDLLEDGVFGPLYKTVVLEADLRFRQLEGPYPFSVSKINQLLSLFVVVLFLLLASATLHRYFGWWCPPYFTSGVVVLDIVAVVVLDLTSPKRRKAAFDGSAGENLFVVVLFLLLGVFLLAVWWWWPRVSSVVIVILTIEAVAVLCHWGRTNLDWKHPKLTKAKSVHAVRRRTKISPPNCEPDV